MTGKLRNMASVYLLRGNEILLLYRQGGRVVNNVWTGSAGGHFEEHELNDARACVLRELKEETGITEDKLTDLALRYITLRNTRGEIRQNYYFFAKVNCSDPISSNEGILKWFPIDEIGELEMPYSAKYMIGHYLAEGMFTDKVYGGIATGEGVAFHELTDF